MNWVGFGVSNVNISLTFTVKWLGKDSVGSFALDGREKKADVIQGVRRWVAARGRNVTLPGMYFKYLCWPLTNPS